MEIDCLREISHMPCASYLEAGFATKLDTFYFSVNLKSAASLLGKRTVVSGGQGKCHFLLQDNRTLSFKIWHLCEPRIS